MLDQKPWPFELKLLCMISDILHIFSLFKQILKLKTKVTKRNNRLSQNFCYTKGDNKSL